MNQDTFNTISTIEIEHCCASDQGGGCFVARVPSQEIGLESELNRFRKCHLEFERPNVSEQRRYRLFNDIENEMEHYNSSELKNYLAYTDCIEIWGRNLDAWVSSVYQNDTYIAHLSFRDIQREGVYESVTKTAGYHVYWIHR